MVLKLITGFASSVVLGMLFQSVIRGVICFIGAMVVVTIVVMLYLDVRNK